MTDAEQPSHQPDTCPCALCQAIRELVVERDAARADLASALAERDAARARVAALEALIQQTCGCHHSWVDAAERERERADAALVERDAALARVAALESRVASQDEGLAAVVRRMEQEHARAKALGEVVRMLPAPTDGVHWVTCGPSNRSICYVGNGDMAGDSIPDALRAAGCADLAEAVEWTTREVSDGAQR